MRRLPRVTPVIVPVLLALAGCAPAPAAGAPVAVRPGPRPVARPMLPTYQSAITAVSAADLPASWRRGCPVAPERLRLVTVTYVDPQGSPGTGRIVVHADVAAQVAAVFGDLYALRFPLSRVEPVDVFGGSDDASMAADNTSGFNCRPTTGGTGFSEHSYGTAIDLNPVENPYVKGTTVLPAAGRAFVERRPAPGVVLDDDAVVRAFAARGFSWGGTWTSLKDYQHFSISGD